MCIRHFFDKVIRISACVFAFLNLAIIIVGLVYLVSANWSNEEAFREIVKSKGFNDIIYFIFPTNHDTDNFFGVPVLLIFFSSILLFILRWRSKVRINIGILLLINIYFILKRMSLVVTRRELNKALIELYESGEIGIKYAFTSISFDFDIMLYFVLLLFNSVFLWRMSEKRSERETN